MKKKETKVYDTMTPIIIGLLLIVGAILYGAYVLPKHIDNPEVIHTSKGPTNSIFSGIGIIFILAILGCGLLTAGIKNMKKKIKKRFEPVN